MVEYRVKVYEDRTEWRNLDGKCHREDGPAVEYKDGYKAWYKDGEFHRLDGPAVEWSNGTKHWFIDGKFHRLDGPAIEWASGRKQWWINNKQYTEEEFRAKTQSTQSKKPLANKTIEIDGVEYILV